MRRWFVALGLALLVGCPSEPPTPFGDTEQAATEGPTDDDADSGSDESGAVGPDGIVDCSLVNDDATVAGGPLNAFGFPPRCDPSTDPSDGEYTCCSDDPSAVMGQLPSYENKNITGGTPIFADGNNVLSRWGLCVRTADVPIGSGLSGTLNCPVPCNPTWSDEDIAAVCGASRVCCQTQELEPEDCLRDLVTGEWRPATGADVLDQLTTWAPAEHATHQDPGGTGCALFAGDPSGDAFEDCVLQLTVADQRGYCMALAPGEQCPHEDPAYVDACEELE